MAGTLLMAAEPPAEADAGRVGVPRDWSHRHVVFARPATFGRLAELQNDARFWHQTYKAIMPLYQQERHATPNVPAAHRQDREPDDPTKATNGSGVKIDWGESGGVASLTYGDAGNYPAKYSFDVSNPKPDCTNDFVVLALPTATSAQANLVACNNLYVDNDSKGTCPGTLPTELFTYVENAASAQFHVVKWKAGDVAGTFGAPANAARMVNCAANRAVAPCEYSVIYDKGSATLSAAWIDYATDTAYVSSDAGKIVAISTVFGGGQPVVTFTVTLGGTNLTSPVYDSVSKNVFAADKKGTFYYIRTALASAGTCAAGLPPCVGAPTLSVANNNAIVEAPVVDSGSGTVFAFSSHGLAGSNSTVVQTTTTLSSSGIATIGPVGSQNVRAGTFDNNYFNSPSTGLLYMCGTAAGNIPQLYGIQFTGSLMNGGLPPKALWRLPPGLHRARR